MHEILPGFLRAFGSSAPLTKRPSVIVRTLWLIAFALLVAVSGARGQSIPATSPKSASEEDLLAREVDDPTGILRS
jgi:hypothetical protein